MGIHLGKGAQELGGHPHWHRPNKGEHRSPVVVIVFLVIFLQYILPNDLSFGFQHQICIVEASLAILLIALSPTRISERHKPSRILSLILTTIMTVSNTASAFLLIGLLVTGTAQDPNHLLLSGGTIWLTNIIIFSLWFWDLDRGGPGARAEAINKHPDFIFPQMSDPHYAPDTWHPNFFDYLYTSFTNASAFSPTDVLPLTRWAKMLMLVQSLTSLLTVGLIVARAVNILH
jgi:uncharacterized membrane protein